MPDVQFRRPPLPYVLLLWVVMLYSVGAGLVWVIEPDALAKSAVGVVATPTFLTMFAVLTLASGVGMTACCSLRQWWLVSAFASSASLLCLSYGICILAVREPNGIPSGLAQIALATAYWAIARHHWDRQQAEDVLAEVRNRE